jgi:penicillin-binding protein 1A
MENGLTAATIFNDAPIVLPGGELEEVYRPRNSGDVFHGNIRLREALYRSINLVSLRVILEYGPRNAIEYVKRFGFDTTGFPLNVQLAFGGGTIALTPLEIATGYATFANGGYKVNSHIISEINSIDEHVVYQELPDTVCRADDCLELPAAKRVIEPRVAYVMNSILSDVITRGTGIKAYRALKKRRDLKGKTGTTNDADIWFSGFTHDLVATVWIGFDNNGPVGKREWGSTTPIETWIAYMKDSLPPESESSILPFPDNLVNLNIDPETGLRASLNSPFITEMFREEHAPPAPPILANKDAEPGQPLEQIF